MLVIDISYFACGFHASDPNHMRKTVELAKKHTKSLRSLETDLNYLSEEAKSSLEKFKKLEKHQEEEFEVYLDKFVNDI